MPNNLAVSYGQPSGYPNPTFFLGNFATDPVNTSPGQWWYNTTSMEIKGNINGSIQILGAFASSFSSTTYITNDTTIGGQGITVNYVDLVITNNATLTIAAGSNVNVAGALNITAGASLVLQGATLNIYNALQNAGTFQSTSASDSIQAVQVQNTGVMQINGTLYLPSAGYNHILAGTISGTGTLNIQGTAITLIGDQLSLSISTVNGSGTYQIQQNGVCTINGNMAMSLANVTGTGTVSIPSGNTLTFSGSNLLPSTLTVNGTLVLANNYTLITNITYPTGTGTVSISSGYTLTISSNISVSFPISGSGTLSISSNYTLTISNNLTFSIAAISGGGTLTIASGYTLTQGASITLSVSTVNIAGTWANAGYGITIPSGSTVTWNLTGSFTTASTAGTLTVNGTLYWLQSNLLPTGASSTFPSFPLTLAGTGIMIAGYDYESPASNKISFSSTAIAAGSTDGSTTSSGYGYEWYYLSSIKGSAVGKYCLATYNGSSYYQNALIYIGTANTSYSVSIYYFWSNYYNPASGTTIYAANLPGSAGTITISGGLYV